MSATDGSIMVTENASIPADPALMEQAVAKLAQGLSAPWSADGWRTLADSTQKAVGLFSQVAGVIAAFAFTAIILVAGSVTGPGPPDEPAVGHVACSLVSVLIGMAAASFYYAEVAGELGPPQPEAVVRLWLLNATASFIFAMAAVQLFYGVTLLLRVYRLGDAAGLSHWVCRGVQLVGIVSYLLHVTQIHGAGSNDAGQQPWYTWYVVMASIMLLMMTWMFARRLRWRPRGQELAKWAVGLTAGAGIYFMMIQLEKSTYPPSTGSE